MGAAYVEHSYEKCSVEQLRKIVKRDCQIAEHECGHQDSGNWGEKVDDYVEVHDKTYSSFQDAHEYLLGKCDKRGPLIAVKVLKNTLLKSLDSLDEKLKDLEVQKVNLEQQMSIGQCSIFPTLGNSLLKRAKSAKSNFKGCTACGSKVAIGHLKSAYCPVCGNGEFLLTNTDMKKIESLKSKLSRLCRKIKETKAKKEEKIKSANNKKGGEDFVWLVGARCSS